jgi:ABC-type nitrate/sulfonate/bicarbonate transport system substrate-binding protein
MPRLISLGAIAAVVLLAACAPTAAPPAAPAAPTAAAAAPTTAAAPATAAAPSSATRTAPATPTKLRVVAIPGTAIPSWVYQYGIRRGWFMEEGLDLEMSYTFQQVPALLGGSADVLNAGAEDMVIANYRGGADIIAVGVINNHPLQFVMATEDIKDPQQMVGKAAGMTDLNSGDAFVTRRYLQKNNIDPNRVTFRRVGGSRERFAAIEAGQIQITPLDPIIAIRARATGKYNILATPNDLGQWPWNVVHMKRDWAQANRDTVVRLLRAAWRTMAYMNDPRNDEEVLRELPAATEIDAAQLRQVYEALRGLNVALFDAERPKPADLEVTVEFERELGVITTPVDTARMIDTSYYDAAISR